MYCIRTVLFPVVIIVLFITADHPRRSAIPVKAHTSRYEATKRIILNDGNEVDDDVVALPSFSS
jgi:hypothetical protein